MKLYTDFEQSKRLAKILPPESADMHYIVVEDEQQPSYIAGLGNFFGKYIGKPSSLCWSLAALLSLLPRPTLHQTNDGKWYCDITDNRTYFSKHYDNPVDACVEMVSKLKELNLSK